jgi:cell division septal protein FtsQ
LKTNVKQPQKKQSVKSNTTKPNKQNKKQINKKKNVKIRRKIVAFLGLLIFCIIIFNIVIFSNLFKIRKITVINNSKLNAEEIIQNSGLKIGNKLFRPSSGKIKNKVQENAYIEHAKITKKINGEVIIDVQERTPAYMLQLEDGYGYINNQGYILEVSQIAMELPIIKGYETQDISAGKRLDVEDLEKLDIVNQIIETAKSHKINNIITAIDITNKNNFLLEIPSESKTVEFGDGTNINIKILWIIDLINRNKGIPGSIIVNVQNIKKVYFREKV